eukprot:GHVN01071811.1.p1 GENE.GHVN01071811.1~~GHVN01071811.1.p1  ORF type:complete len:150 (-),score=13.04 GHVN01071811.1:129-578(-)
MMGLAHLFHILILLAFTVTFTLHPSINKLFFLTDVDALSITTSPEPPPLQTLPQGTQEPPDTTPSFPPCLTLTCYTGHLLIVLSDETFGPSDCQAACQQLTTPEACTHFSFNVFTNRCSLFKEILVQKSVYGCVSGPRLCGRLSAERIG